MVGAHILQSPSQDGQNLVDTLVTSAKDKSCGLRAVSWGQLGGQLRQVKAAPGREMAATLSLCQRLQV